MLRPRNREQKKGIVPAAFGTGVEEARQGYDNIDRLLREAFPDVPIRWAFTSEKLRERMERCGDAVLSVAEVMTCMNREGFTHVAVLPLQTIPGVEFDWTKQQAEAFQHPRKGFDKVGVAAPLLSSRDDLQRAAEALKSYMPAERGPQDAVVLVGHGAVHKSHGLYAEFLQVAAADDPLLISGALTGKGGLADVLDGLRGLSVRKVFLLPFMCVPGFHVQSDIAGDDEESWTSVLEREGYQAVPIIKGTAEHEPFVDMWIDHLRRTLAEMSA